MGRTWTKANFFFFLLLEKDAKVVSKHCFFIQVGQWENFQTFCLRLRVNFSEIQLS